MRQSASKSDLPRRSAWRDRQWIFFVIGIFVYAIAFFATLLPSFGLTDGPVTRRWQILNYVLLPDVIASGWFGDPAQWELSDRIPILGTALAVTGVGFAIGYLLLAKSKVQNIFTSLERLILSIAVGMNVISLYVLVVGLCGLLRDRALLIGPGLIVAIAAVWMARSEKWSIFRSSTLREMTRSGWFWTACPFALLLVLGGMLPPLDFDVREYHLQVPKEFYQAGKICSVSHNVYGNMPLASEMHSLVGMVLLGDWWRGALVGKTIQSLFALCTALLLVAAGSRWYSTSAGALAALIYLSLPWIAVVSTSGLVEGVASFYLLSSFYVAVLCARQPGQAHVAEESTHRELIFLTGFLAGSAVGVKYPAALFVVLPIAMWIGYLEKTRLLRSMAIFFVAVGLAAGLWFAKNWYFTGNPTYPLLSNLFRETLRNQELLLQWQRAHQPVSYSFNDFARQFANVLLRSEWLSLLVWPLAFTTILFVRPARISTRMAMRFFGYIFLTWWCFTHRIDRFWVPALAVVAMTAGASWNWAMTPWRRITLVIFIAVGLVYSAVLIAGPSLVYNRYFVSLERLRVDPDRVTAWQLWLNQHTPPGETVMAVGEGQVFDLEMPVLYNTVFDRSVFERAVCNSQGELRSTPEIRQRLHDVAFIYVHWGEIARYRSPGNYGFSPFVQSTVFADLVERQILAPPVKEFADGTVQIFPVLHGALQSSK